MELFKLKVENINNISQIPTNNNIKVGLFTNNSLNQVALFYCNLIDDTFLYYNLKEDLIEELLESNIIFNVFFINKSLDFDTFSLLLKYSNKHNTKIIYAPSDGADLNNQKELINYYDVIIVNGLSLKESLNSLNSNILFIPSNIEEEYEIIKESHMFDEEDYIFKYQLSNNFNPILHYLLLGFYENCNPLKEFELNDFLNSYPGIKKYKINPFVYYVILNQLYRINSYYPSESFFKNPQLSRLVLWGDNQDIINDVDTYFQNEYINDFHFEIIDKNNKLIFKQKNKIHFKHDYLIKSVCKSNLMIKNRSTGKRILKEIKDFEAELSDNDLLELGIMGIYDTYVQVSTLDKDFLFRINFDKQNNDKILRDKSNYMIFAPYETLDNYLAFRYRWANFLVEWIDVINKNDDLFFTGEITLFDDLNFNSIELEMFLNQVDMDRKLIDCDYTKFGNTIHFCGKIDFKYYSTDLSKNFKIDVHLKDKFGMKVGSRYLRGYKMDCLKKDLKKYVKKSVLFESFHGKFYSGQPKYIYEKMLELGLDSIYDFVWSYYGKFEIPGSPLITSRKATNFKEILGASDYWISNINFPLIKPSEDIIYLQTTHGTPYKHMGSDIESDDENIPTGNVVVESDTWNYLISPSDYAKDIFVRSFEYDGPVINKGYPANDIFYKDTDVKQKELKEKFNIDFNKKVILYCPTFRDYDVDESNHRKFSLLVDLNKLYENLHEEYVIIMRLHYVLSKNLVISDEMKNSIIDLSDYDDVSELYLISDILISDYSSAFFDFAHSKKPILFFVPDFEKYSSFRGLYSEVTEELPGPKIVTNDELVDCIKNIDVIKKQYEEKYDLFYEKFCGLGHGTATKDVIDIVFGDDINE